ncbi:MAG: hypothetical protein M0R74_08880 [Dehalococcoidia bacterium]|nr:hypothetical protein [Dehalococcoidia bacterium]
MFAAGQLTDIDRDHERGQDWVVDLRSRRVVRRKRRKESAPQSSEPVSVDKKLSEWRPAS